MSWPSARGTSGLHLGYHPQLVAERAGELDLWGRYLSETRYVGEVGLDAGPRFYKSIDLQKRVFQHVLQRCAEAGDKVITIYRRGDRAPLAYQGAAWQSKMQLCLPLFVDD